MLFLNYATIIDPLLRGLRAYAVEFSGIKAGDRVLDVCCGTGDQAFHYARAGGIVTGIDLDPNMLELAGKDKRRTGSVSFQLADACYLPFRDNCFDCAAISLALHEKEGAARDKVIMEMKRVVRKGGALIFIDFQAPLARNKLSRLVKVIEFFAGRNHHRCFRDFIEQGGLAEILKKNQLNEDKRDYCYDRLITIIRTINSEHPA